MAIDFPQDLALKIKTRKISYGAALSLRFLGAEDRKAVCALLEELRPSCALMQEFSELIVDISKKDNSNAIEIITGFKETMAGRCSRKIKIEQIRRALRERRFPELTKKEKVLKSAVSGIPLPRNVSLNYPANLEGKRASLTITFESASELRKSLDEIKNKAVQIDEFLKIL